MGPIYSIADFLDMLRRRIGLISFVILLGCVLSVFYALSQPHVYSSAEVIQIKQPKIADDLAPSTVEGSAARRLQLIQQQLMARGSLLETIDQFGLYKDLPDLRDSEKVAILRHAISIEGVAAPAEGFGEDGVISVLTIAARMDDPQLARDVAHHFANRTRALTETQRRNQTEDTLAFFQQREEALAYELRNVEDEIVAFRTANNLSIDGSISFRRDELASLNDALLELDREIIAAQLALSRIDRSVRAATVARQESEMRAELESLATQRQLLQQRREALSTSLETSPEVEQALANFERRRSQVQSRLDSVINRRTDAEVGFSLEAANQGERMTTLEEAQVPDYPISRSRKMMAVMGAVLSTVLALGLAFLLDLRRPVVRTAEQMERETGLLPVVSIPVVGANNGRGGLGQFWNKRSAAGRRGRDARVARASHAGQ